MARRGTNPTKLHGEPPPYGIVRLIVPLHLPSQQGYYEEGLRVFEAMLESVASTTDERVRLTVINNGSSESVARTLDAHQRDGRIDRLIHSRRNRGKRDVVLAELRATYEPISVVADADVVFRSGWVDATFAGFAAFPECGLLSLHPVPELRWLASTSILAGARAAGARLCRAAVVDPDDIERFSKSIGRTAQPQPAEGQLLVTRAGNALMLGFSHFAFAVRREAVADLPAEAWPHFKFGTDMEQLADAAGWWCASLPRALVHHVGNTLDDEEEHRIKTFTATSFIEPVADFGDARRSSVSRRLPEFARQLVGRVGRSAYSRPGLGRIAFPLRDLHAQAGSAIRFVEK